MNLIKTIPENTIADPGQIPKGYLERIVNELAAAGCQPLDVHNNLIRLALLFHQVNSEEKWAFCERFIRLVFTESDEFGESLSQHLLGLNRELSSKGSEKGGGDD